MKIKKLLTILVAMALVSFISVMGTLAYLTAKTGEVTNTFSAPGLLENADDFVLKEHKASEDTTTPGKYNLGSEEVTANEYTNVVPGQDIDKDPFVRVKKLKADAYLYVEIDGSDMPATLTWLINDTNWEELSEVKTHVNGSNVKVYTYKLGVLTASGTNNLEVGILKGNKVTVAAAHNTEAGGGTLDFHAYLVQKTGFTDAKDAWNNTYGK